MAPAVRNLEKGNQLKIICIKDREEIIGIAPLKKRSCQINGIVAYTVIETISERAPGILLKKRKAECLNTLMAHLYAEKDWDFLYFKDIPETFSIVNLLRKNSSKIDFEMAEEDVSPYLIIPDSLDALYANISPSFRHNLRNDLRRLEKNHGKITFKEYHELGSLEEMMNKFFEIHQKRWVKKGQSGVFKTKRHRDIFFSEAKYFSEINRLRLYFLLVNDKPISVFYGYEHNHALYYLLGGFDPDYAAYGPHNLQLLKILEKCIENKIKELNFFAGYTPPKFRWCKSFRRNYSFKFVNNSVHSKALSLANRITRQKNIRDKLSKILKSAGIFMMTIIILFNWSENIELLILSL